uniref:AAA domain-containing protein n=1 Tax=Prymnesium polylepis TaxID=72548 RepID=A0A6T8A3P5_9EUKA|mmetsp:Transcript_31195/g.76719  ORF Transcript_31195/g.76719 Transcript_31195/m.76719 type:complete len:519 (+) Transcript_31195:86-1642(+)
MQNAVAAPTPAALRVCVYNYKGGAAKTTIVVNASAALAHPKYGNKKVLLIDLDPQCNSTQFFHDDAVGRTLSKEETTPTVNNAAAATLLNALPANGVEPGISEDALHPTCGAAAMDALVSQGRNPLYQMMHALYTEQESNRIRIMIATRREGLLHKISVDQNGESEFGDNFYILEGDPMIAQFESDIAHAFSNFGLQSQIKSYGLFSHMMQLFAEILNFDVIMVDCSPSNSAINKAAALACDYILPPCMAALYSAGSIHGLLTSVLPGEDGWLGLHEKITERWRDEDNKLEPKTSYASLSAWLLPKSAPVLLPIVVSNYAMGHEADVNLVETPGRSQGRGRGGARSSARGRARHNASTDGPLVMKQSHSQFVYTINNFINRECRHIHGHTDGPLPSFRGPLVRFRENNGRRILCFTPSAPVSMPVAEQVGRSYVELTEYDFLEYYFFDSPLFEKFLALPAENGAICSSSGGKKRKAEQSSFDFGPDMPLFQAEVSLMKKRYGELAQWLIHLLADKRQA